MASRWSPALRRIFRPRSAVLPELLGWSVDGRRLFYRESRGTTTRLYALPLDGEPEGVGPEDGVVSEAALNPTRKAIGFAYQTSDQLVIYSPKVHGLQDTDRDSIMFTHAWMEH